MVSVVIPTRNRAPLLRAALLSLQQQTLASDRFEVLVIDNGSTDDTAAVVQEFVEQARVRYFFDPTPGLHVGRHRGLKEAASDILVYADDDIEATPTWLEAIEDCFRDDTVALVGGNNLPKFESAPPPWLQKLWEQPAYGGRAITWLSVLELPPGRREVSPFSVWGCNFSIRRRILLDAGGFHPDGVPDSHIQFRGDGETHVSSHVLNAGLRTMFDSNASVHHRVTRSRMTHEYFRKRAFNQGVSDSYRELRNAAAQPRPSGFASPRNVIRSLVRGARARLNALTRDAELRALDRVIDAGYREGYTYHQAAYRDDPEVRAWVHKPDYF
jgi:glucosyl-dolichyl phosphate glucuronosyltransferase